MMCRMTLNTTVNDTLLFNKEAKERLKNDVTKNTE